jgi:hypothetical protein
VLFARGSFAALGAMKAMQSLTINPGERRDGSSCFFIKLQGKDCELNVTASAVDLDGLQRVSEARWLDRTCFRAGECLGSPVYWSCEDGRLAVLAGHDEETWDIGVFLSDSVVVDLLAEISRVRGK